MTRLAPPLLAAALALLAAVAMPSSSRAQSPAGPPEPPSGPRVIFEQPVLAGIAGNFRVPPAEHKYPYDKPFYLILWQPNPNRPDGQLVPTDWRAGGKTGFYPAGSLLERQAAFRNAADSSTLQIDGDTVGVYLNSHDLPNGSPGGVMMITPALTITPPAVPASGPHLYPFAESGLAIVTALELQIPFARDLSRPGNITYVTADLQLEDLQSHTRISYGANVFHHSLRPAIPNTPDRLRQTEVGPYDAPSHSFQVGNALAAGPRVLTVLPGSAEYQSQTWRGWRLFRFAITRSNFVTALAALKEKSPAFAGSDNPADYALTGWHLNAEIQFDTGPAELGWSMRRARLALAPEDGMTAR
jgi:hypothetical protein